MSAHETDATLQIVQRLERKIDTLSTELADARAAAFQNTTTLFGAVERLLAGQDEMSRKIRRELDRTVIWT